MEYIFVQDEKGIMQTLFHLKTYKSIPILCFSRKLMCNNILKVWHVRNIQFINIFHHNHQQFDLHTIDSELHLQQLKLLWLKQGHIYIVNHHYHIQDLLQVTSSEGNRNIINLSIISNSSSSISHISQYQRPNSVFLKSRRNKIIGSQ